MKLCSLLLPAIAVTLAVSCNKKSYLHTGEEPVAAKDSGHWKLVKENPPTMFPEGYPADGGTEFTDGDWIQGGSVRWFVPSEGAKGVSQRELTREALAMQTGVEKQQLKWQEAGFSAKESLAKLLVGLGMGLAEIGAGMPSSGGYSAKEHEKAKKKAKKKEKQ